MSNYLETKSFHHLLVISRIFIFFIIFFISFFHNAFSSELDNLFLRLKQSENPILARIYESKIRKLWLKNGTSDASIFMVDNEISTTGITSALGTTSSIKKYTVQSGPTSNILTLGTHELLTGEKIRVISDDGDLPENLTENTVYFAIKQSSTQIKIAASKTNATLGTAIVILLSGLYVLFLAGLSTSITYAKDKFDEYGVMLENDMINPFEGDAEAIAVGIHQYAKRVLSSKN